MPKKKATPETFWTNLAKKLLVGRTIHAVRYMTKKEMEAMGWDQRCIIIKLDDGNFIYPSQDDEGNGPGALFTNKSDIPVIN